MRTTSRSRTRVLLGTRSVWRATLDSLSAGRRSVLCATLNRSPTPASAPRNAVSTRSGAAAKLVSPSREAKTAPPISAAPHRPVRIVPLNHCNETRRRSTSVPVPPSTESGGSLPSSMGSVFSLRFAPRTLAWSKTPFPRSRDRVPYAAYAAPSLVRSPERIPKPRGPDRLGLKRRIKAIDAATPIQAASTRPGRRGSKPLADAAAPPALRHPRHDCVKNGGGMWPQCGARTAKSHLAGTWGYRRH